MGPWGIRCPPIGVNTAEAIKELGVSPGSVTGGCAEAARAAPGGCVLSRFPRRPEGEAGG